MTRTYEIELTGLDGSNPLAFLAALGVLQVAGRQEAAASPRLHWTPALRPVLETSEQINLEDLVSVLCEGIRQLSAEGVADLGDIIGVAAGVYENFVRDALDDAAAPAAQERLRFAAAYGTSANIDAKKGTLIPNALSFSNGQGGKLLLKDFRTLAAAITLQHLREALFEPWQYKDQDLPTFRWDPQDMRTGAHMATDPGSTPTRSVMAANALAFAGLSFLPTMPGRRGIDTTAVRPIDGEISFCWPLWSGSASRDVVRSLLQQKSWQPEHGVFTSFRAPRINFKKNLYLGGAVMLPTADAED